MKRPNPVEWLIIAALVPVLALACASISTHAIREARLQEFGSCLAQVANALSRPAVLNTEAVIPLEAEPLSDSMIWEEIGDLHLPSDPGEFSSDKITGGRIVVDRVCNASVAYNLYTKGGDVNQIPADLDGWDEIEQTFDP